MILISILRLVVQGLLFSFHASGSSWKAANLGAYNTFVVCVVKLTIHIAEYSEI